MANEENLKGHGFDSLTAEERREKARNAGIASGEARRKKKELKEYLEILMSRDAGRDSSGNKITSAEAMAITAVKAAMNGDWRAWELVRDTAGQKPVEKVMIAEVDQAVIDEVERIVLGEES